MNNKNLLEAIALKMNISTEQTQNLMDSFVKSCEAKLKEEQTIGFHGFGAFEVRKRDQREAVNPQNGQRTLIPPKLVVSFRQSTILKEKINA